MLICRPGTPLVNLSIDFGYNLIYLDPSKVGPWGTSRWWWITRFLRVSNKNAGRGKCGFCENLGGVDFNRTKSITRLQPCNVIFWWAYWMLTWTTPQKEKHATLHFVICFPFQVPWCWILGKCELLQILFGLKMWSLLTRSDSKRLILDLSQPQLLSVEKRSLFTETAVLLISSHQLSYIFCCEIIIHVCKIYEAPHLPPSLRCITTSCLTLSDICKCRSHVLHNSIHGWSKQHRTYRNYASSPEFFGWQGL